MPFAAGDLPDEPARTTPGTRGANASFGTFRPVAGKNFPDFTSFTYWQGSNTTDDFNAGTHEVAGTGWSIEGMTKGMIWGYRTLRSDYEEHKTLLRDLESQNTAHAAATLDSFTQVRGILDHLRADDLALRAELVAVRTESVHDRTLAVLSGENEALKAEQQRLLRIINNQADLITAVAQQANRVEESVRLYELAYSGRLDEMATSHLNLETAFRGERVRLDASAQQAARVEESLRHYQLGYSGRLDDIETAAGLVRGEFVRTWTRVEHESTRTGNMHKRLRELEEGTNRSGYATHLSGYAKLRIDKLEQALKREREDGADTSE
jgi:hypothetical protein